MGATLPDRLAEAVGALAERPITVTDKGFGGLAWQAPESAGGLARRRPSLFGGDFMLPLVILRESALSNNITSMADYCAAAGVRLAPHGKTTMAPQLLARQLEAGAWAITAATIGQVQVFRSFGIPRILIANEVTDRAGLEWLAAELAADPDFECYCFADSLAGVALLDDAMRALTGGSGKKNQPRLRVLVELGQVGSRAGCRSVDDALAVAKAVSAAPALCLGGAAGYEGSIGHDDSDATLAAIAEFCRDLRHLGERLSLLPECQNDYLLSAGGSAYFDVVVRELTASPSDGTARPTVVLRGGAYISYDHGFYTRLAPGARPDRPGPRFLPAFELWAPVLSRPESGLAIVGAGRQHVAFDQDLPIPLRARPMGAKQASSALVAGTHVSAVDDQHAYLRVPPESVLGPGDVVCMGISHPCTTFDKWRVIPVVDDDYHVVDAIHTFF